MKKALLLGLGAMIFGGCYSGVEDAGGGSSVGDRWGRACYYSYSNGQSAEFASKGSDASSAKTDDGFQLTMKADVSMNPEEVVATFDEMRRQAGIAAQDHINAECRGSEQSRELCEQTCQEQAGLVANDRSTFCDTCRIFEDGTWDCGPGDLIPPSLAEALAQPWFGQEPWAYDDDGANLHLQMQPPVLIEDWNGELVWMAEVVVDGVCLCSCAG